MSDPLVTINNQNNLKIYIKVRTSFGLSLKLVWRLSLISFGVYRS